MELAELQRTEGAKRKSPPQAVDGSGRAIQTSGEAPGTD